MAPRLQIDAVIERRRNVFYVSDLGPYLDQFQAAFRDQLDFFSFQKRGKWKLRDSPANRLSLRSLGIREYYDVTTACMVPL
ncbi:MAG: hypothetical protein M1358_15250 [Chloroflexi bacterium]|nr:hypothetical protein [Chloroflexota bacterium]